MTALSLNMALPTRCSKVVAALPNLVIHYG
jgi:hypothetical protein